MFRGFEKDLGEKKRNRVSKSFGSKTDPGVTITKRD